MSKFKLEFTLKQHTPLIHFQYNQSGATLRATELKPKLDRFLIEKFKKENTNFDKWLNRKDPPLSLDYKIKIKYAGDIEYYLPLASIANRKKQPLIDFIKQNAKLDIILLEQTPYFGNSDKIEFTKINNSFIVNQSKTKVDELKFATLSKSEIDVSIFSFNEDLLRQIQNNLILFFLHHNFGTRQNKGFGSFTVESLNNQKISVSEEQLNKVFTHQSNIELNNYNKIFAFILDEYQLLKSGKNYPQYKKSEIFKHFIKKGIRWEKRYIKKYINTNKIMNKELYWTKKSAPIDFDNSTSDYYNDWTDTQNNTYGYIRALLGLAEQFEYTVFNRRRDGSDRQMRYVVSVEHNPASGQEKIERFQSPIFFKVIDNKVYIGLNESYNNILGEEFNFKLKLKGDSSDTLKNIGNIKIPQSFDLEDFVNKHVSNKWEKL